MELNRLVSTFQAPAVSLLVLGMFFWHTLIPLIPTSQLYMNVYFIELCIFVVLQSKQKYKKIFTADRRYHARAKNYVTDMVHYSISARLTTTTPSSEVKSRKQKNKVLKTRTL